MSSVPRVHTYRNGHHMQPPETEEVHTPRVEVPAPSESVLVATVDEALDTVRAENAPVFVPMSLAELLTMPPKPWLIDQVLGAGDLAMIYGPSGGGKTFVTIDLIFSACLGRTWADRFSVERPLTVAYSAGEGIGGLPARFRAASEYYGVRDLPGFHFFKQVPQLHRREGSPFRTTENIERFVADWGDRPLDLLVIDTFHTATVGAKENDSEDMGLVIDAAKAAQRKIGCTVVFVHHSTKTGTSERGSGSLRGAMDTMIGLKQIGAKWAICCEKLKDGAEWAPQTFTLTDKADSVRVWWHAPIGDGDDGDSGKQEQDKQKIINLLSETGEALTDKEIEMAVAVSRAQVNKLLVALTEDGLIERGKRNPQKPKSSRNPWVYFLPASETESVESESDSVQDDS